MNKIIRAIAIGMTAGILFGFTFNLAFGMSVGVVSDIHIGKLNTRKSGTSIVYPKKAISYFEKAVKEMKGKKVDLIVALGDNTQVGGSKYYRQLKAVEKKYGIKILWVKGNHDDKNFKILGPSTYIYDFDGKRYIILNTGLCSKAQKNAGCLDQSQVDFLHENYRDGDIILQHVPPLISKTCNFRTDFIAEEDMIVLSGHFHQDTNCENVRVFPALTEHKKIVYKIINL